MLALRLTDHTATGKGPAWMAKPHIFPIKLNFEKLATRRFMTFLGPCFEDDAHPNFRRFFRTRIGRILVDALFSAFQKDLLKRGGYEGHSETEKLLPLHDVGLSGSTVGILNYPSDILDLVRQERVHIHIAGVSSLSEKTIHLHTSQGPCLINADMLICATGWHAKPSIIFETPSFQQRHRFPQPLTHRRKPTSCRSRAQRAIPRDPGADGQSRPKREREERRRRKRRLLVSIQVSRTTHLSQDTQPRLGWHVRLSPRLPKRRDPSPLDHGLSRWAIVRRSDASQHGRG